MRNLTELPPDMLRTISLEMMRTIYESTRELETEILKEWIEQRKHVFKGRLLCLAMLANVAFVLNLSRGSLSQSNDFFLFLNCVALAVSGVVLGRHVVWTELPWRAFRKLRRRVSRGVAEMREALEEIEKAEKNAQR